MFLDVGKFIVCTKTKQSIRNVGLQREKICQSEKTFEKIIQNVRRSKLVKTTKIL